MSSDATWLALSGTLLCDRRLGKAVTLFCSSKRSRHGSIPEVAACGVCPCSIAGEEQRVDRSIPGLSACEVPDPDIGYGEVENALADCLVLPHWLGLPGKGCL